MAHFLVWTVPRGDRILGGKNPIEKIDGKKHFDGVFFTVAGESGGAAAPPGILGVGGMSGGVEIYIEICMSVSRA